ncbi:MAG: hypothetical protein KF851_07545 [Pirellulaceae bacterium]|nr:hypothetical protein [Pirellulaceae bacterium]
MTRNSFSEKEWLEAYKRYSQDSIEKSLVSRKVYDALVSSGLFEIAYTKTVYQVRAHFRVNHNNVKVELVRSTIHTGEREGLKKGVGMAKEHHEDWPDNWQNEFENEFGKRLDMSGDMVESCIHDDERLDRWIKWLLEKGEKYPANRT